MSSDFTPFLNYTYPMPVLQERARIIQTLTQYAVSDWQDIYKGVRDPRAYEFQQSVDGLVANYFTMHQEIPKRLMKAVRQPRDTVELVVNAFDKASHFDEAPFAIPHFNDAEIISAFEYAFDAKLIGMGGEAKPTVQGAYDMAYNNFLQANGRMLAVRSLYQLLRYNEWDNNDLRFSQVESLMSHLWERQAYHMRNMLLFGGLLGGKTNARTLKLVARQTCHKEDPDGIQFGIMHLLTSDGRHPGIYPTLTEASFRADVKALYDSL